MDDYILILICIITPILTGIMSWLIYRVKNQILFLKIVGVIPLTLFGFSIVLWGIFLFICAAFWLDGGSGWHFG